MELYVKVTYISTFSLFFWFSNVILSNALILPVSQLQAQQVMTSQIRSHIEYIKQDLLYSFAHILVETDEIFSHNGGF